MVRFLNSLIEGSSDAIFVAEVRSGLVVYANPAACKLFECQRFELVGCHQSDLHPKEDLESISRNFNELVHSDTYKETTAHILTKTGKKKLVLITSANLFEVDSQKFASAYFKDISYVETLQEIAFDQSHLVRRPLANILGIAKLLDEKAFDSADINEELIGQLHAEARVLDSVIKSVTHKSIQTNMSV